jgi:hypothetical protein
MKHTLIDHRNDVIPVHDNRLPEISPYEDLVDRIPFRANVPCGSCTLCCRTLIVPLAHEEYEQYDWAWVTTRDGERLGRALQRRPDGSCVYLGEHGCTIHGRAPHVCQRFDCRELFLKSDRQGRRKAIKSGKLPKELFDKGREMLGK